MPGSSGNSSFIPKRGTNTNTRKIQKGKAYSLTIVSYVLLFASLAASAAVYIYSGVVRAELENEAKAMNEAVGVFREADMNRVQEFDKRLRQANQRLNNSASITSIFTALELATIDTVRFDSLSVERNLDTDFVVDVSIETDNFDSSIFQRSLYGTGQGIEAIEIKDLTLVGGSGDEDVPLGQSVNFRALMSIPLSAVQYTVAAVVPKTIDTVEDVATPESEEVSDTEPVGDEGEVSDNQPGV